MASTRIVEHVGRVLGDRYRLLAPIGSGGSAHVFLADDVKLRRRVAVKVLHPLLADDEAFLRRFRAEARAAAGLNHPNIMAVYDWGEEADGPFLVCELLGGGSLRAMLDRGTRLTPSQALLVGLDAARALDYASRRGLVHRDIKAANLLFDDEGRLRIADFGLARALAEASWTEPSGTVLGTARYASPEQIKGSPLDGKADVYSLAVVLYEAVLGRVPFAADTTVGTLMGRLERPIPAAPELGPLGPIVARAGRPDPAERLDAMALGSALQSVAAELPRPDPLPLVGVAALDDTMGHVDPDPTDVGVPPPALPSTVTTLDVPDAAPTVALPPDPGASTWATPDVPTRVGPAPVPAAPAATALSRKARRRRWPLVTGIVVVALLVAAALVYAVVQAQVPSHRVPDEVGRPETEAVAAVKALHLNPKVERRFADGTTAGQVVAQAPRSGSLKEGRNVTLTVSRGPTPVPVPDLTGRTKDQAVDVLARAGFRLGKLTPRNDEGAPAGQVLDWSPKGGEAPRGTAVDLVVSAGPAPRAVPNVSGGTFEAASAALSRLGLKVARTDDVSDTVPKDQVIGTSPGAGASVDRGSTVSVIVSKGPPVVPSLIGLTVPDATGRLQAVGLQVGNVYGPPGGRVLLSTPLAGSKAKRGSSVTLFIF